MGTAAQQTISKIPAGFVFAPGGAGVTSSGHTTDASFLERELQEPALCVQNVCGYGMGLAVRPALKGMLHQDAKGHVGLGALLGAANGYGEGEKPETASGPSRSKVKPGFFAGVRSALTH